MYKALSAGSTGVQAFVATCTNPPANMTAWWRAEDDANDFVGGHNGSAQNGATFASGKVGQAFSLDGTNDYISVPDSAAWDFGTGDFTIDMWVKFTSVQTQNFFIGHDDGAGNSTNGFSGWSAASFNSTSTVIHSRMAESLSEARPSLPVTAPGTTSP